jgi:hypothetical protein
MGLELADLAVDGCITEIPLAVQRKREAARRIGKIGVKRPAVVNAKGILLWRRQALHLIGARGDPAIPHFVPANETFRSLAEVSTRHATAETRCRTAGETAYLSNRLVRPQAPLQTTAAL